MSTAKSRAANPKTIDLSEQEPTVVRASLLGGVSRANLAALVLGYIFVVHFVGLYIFTKGFLLTRVTIPITSSPYTIDSPAPLPATHSKAIILVIDALRTDFISPHHPVPPSPNHHGVLTLPAELTASHPGHSIILNGYSDPPTTTMQRIKGFTTGSLPTFVDAGSNFASTAIEEDSIISQLVAAGKKVGFMGDDTWVNLFPDSFTFSHPFDSFNVEDLHTVDNGVIDNILPYLHPENASRWDVLIGHFLGVDHVGHRVGPERDTMRTKLEQMNQVVRDVVELMDDETLLVLLGDHGMDSKGNHGGDSDMETAAALWLYSKGVPLIGGVDNPRLVNSWPTYTFPGSTTPLRHVNQIDLVPTLALLLGVPIPFNNLGTIIPECFAANLSRLEEATRVNSEQIMRYIEEYGEKGVKSELAGIWTKAKAATRLTEKVADSIPSIKGGLSEWLKTGSTSDNAEKVKLEASLIHSVAIHRQFSLDALAQLRALWAQFSVPLILLGSLLLGLSIPMLIGLYRGIRNSGPSWNTYASLALETAFVAAVPVGIISGTLYGIYKRSLLQAIQTGIVGTILVSEIILVAPLLVKLRRPSFKTWQIERAIGPMMLVAHAVSFGSNSFIMWEDRVVVYLSVTIVLIYLLKALLAPTADMRLRIIGLSLVYAILIRLVGTVTICREEQQPFCRVTFYTGSTPAAPNWALAAIIILGLQLPRAIGLLLNRSKSLGGPARYFLGIAWRFVLTANALYWIFEYLETWDKTQPPLAALLKLSKLWIARISFTWTLVALPYTFLTSGLCIQVIRDPDQTGDDKAVTVLGFANAFGSTYLLFFLIPFGLIHLVMQPMGQITTSAILLAILIFLELIDTRRDAIIMRHSFATSSQPGAFEPGSTTNTIARPSFTDAVPLALLGFIGFFATGHQAVLTSIQWKAAFVGFESVTYPFSPLLVIINTWGPFALSALAIPLLAIWNVSPIPSGNIPIIAHSLQLSIAFITYHTTVTFASAICAAWLRRHLMVWKVFAPRFMLAGCTLLVVDLMILVAVCGGLRITSWKVRRTFRCESI
ncbi:phosphoethanolamine N-methyltransferase [Naematelia encephala]|uniref:Phosphoethanolamine N-methyltransferase n=1 Tax=Naematelia encephala TaxID=71784 RepID=A0A1Y2ALH1_9TREE|nr:phosphoethanolamine N-methyltransferase [Naematelia encephala]